jgi:colanic acid biosynthesis glycosyl transferase WcaI
MKILVVSQYFWPENFRINDLCAGLVERGHEVTVLTAKPSYPDGFFLPEFIEDPEKYRQYHGCDIVRAPIVSRGQGSSLKLVANYISFFFSASTIGLWMLRKRRFDIVFVCQLSPVTIALPALLYKRIYKQPVVMWVLDLWPESLSAVGAVKSKKLLSMASSLISYIYKNCDLILCQSKMFQPAILKHYDQKKNVRYFPSWSEKIFEVSAVADKLKFDSDVFKVLFAGNIGDAQDFPSILMAAEILKEREANICLFIVGDGRLKKWLARQVVERGLCDYIHLLGHYPLEEMPSFYASADALLATLKGGVAFSMTIPGKVQSYMLSSRPILTMLSGEGSRVIDEARCGLTANSGEYVQLADNIVKMSNMPKQSLEQFGSNAYEYSANEFDRDTLISQLISWFDETILTAKK